MRIFKAIIAGILVGIGLSQIVAVVFFFVALPIIAVIATTMVSFVASG